MSKIVCGVNGFGRFGLHLLNYYLESFRQSKFQIEYINDDMLSLNHAYAIIKNDPYVKILDRFKLDIDGDYMTFSDTINEDIVKIKYTNQHAHQIEWIGCPDVFLECSGKFTDANKARELRIGATKKVLISATSMNPDQMLVYGFNHKEYKKSSDIISYGSCTVNAYVQLTNRLNQLFGVETSDVNVIHNIPEYQLHNGSIETPGLSRVSIKRKSCTLSVVAPKLLNFISDENFNVNYTLIPYTGVSMIDFRYTLIDHPGSDIWDVLESECSSGDLMGLYKIDACDLGPEPHQNTHFSSVIIRENSYLRGNNLYLQAYFDNENSVNRFFDLTNYISDQIVAEW
jgi:glyceraldehyde 3-phosphate dehydrogenase